MKKLFVSGLILCLLLTGCHGKAETAAFSIPDAFDTARNYEISFWAKNDTNITQVDIYKQAIADFEAIYPNIRVNLRLYTDYGKIYNDVITNISTNTTPNVCITYPDHIATYLTGKNSVLALDELLTDARYGLGGSEVRFDAPTKEQIVPKFLSEGTFGGHQYAMPYMRSTEACYVNKTYVEKLGYALPDVLTWDFVREVSEAAMKKDADGNFAVNGQKVLIPFIYKSTDNMMIQMLYQQGAPYSTPDGQIGLFGEETRQILRTCAQTGADRSFSTFKLSGYPANFLNAGQCIFAVDSTAGATWMGSDAPLVDISEDKLVRFETAVMPVPQIDPENPMMISQGPSLCLFYKEDPQEVLASWLFLQYMLTNGVQIAYAQTEGYAPVTLKAQDDPVYRDYLSRGGEDNALYYDIKIKATELLLSHTDDTFVTPVFNGSASLRDAAGQLIEGTVKASRRKQTVDDGFIDGLYDEVRSLCRLDQVSGMGGRQALGALPPQSAALLIGLSAIWIIIAIYGLINKRKNSKT